MFRLLIVIVLTLLVLAPATSALGQQELPSAPSAVRQQQNQASVPAAPPPASAQQTPKPAPVPEVPAPPPAAPESQDTSKPAAEGGNAESQPQNSNDSGEAGITFVKRVDEVNVIFTVTDKHGKFVKDLEKTDFRILDNNVAPKQIDAFSRETNLPLRIGLLIDASNSIRDRFKFEQDASIEFLNQVVRPKSDRAFVLGFDTTAEVTADFTDSAEELSKGVRMLRPGGGTALYDAIYFACRDKLMKGGQAGPVRRAIVLLSDGEDNQSRVSREQAIEMAERAEVIIYAISTNSTGYREHGDKVMERMAELTGGRAFFPFKIEDVANAFAEIQEELRSQYAISYHPASFANDGAYHSIDITVINRKNLKVRSRKGYSAPKQ